MNTRIVFNGQEYSGPEQMPDDVRKAFQEMLARLSADSDRNGMADGLEGRGNVLGIEQASITVNGRTVENIGDLPLPVRWVLEKAFRRAVTSQAVPTAPRADDPVLKQLESATTVLGTILQLLSAALAAALIVVGSWMIVHMDASSRSQGGAFYVGIGVLIAVAWLARIVVGLAWPRKR